MTKNKSKLTRSLIIVSMAATLWVEWRRLPPSQLLDRGLVRQMPRLQGH